MRNKILVIPNTGLTLVDNDLATEKTTGEFAKELNDLGNEVNIYGQILRDENKIHIYRLNENNIKVKGLFRRKNKLINYILLYSRIIPEILRSDFVYLFYPNSFKYVAILCKVFGKKYGLYVRGMNDLEGKIPNFIFRNASTVLCVSDYFTNYINTITKTNKARSIRPMIDFGINDIVFDREYSYSDQYQLLYLGRMTNDKGIIELLNAVSRLRKENYSFKLKLVGDGEYITELKELVFKLKLDDVVVFEGAVFESEKIRQYFLNADLYILGSYHEGFPRTLYEAMIFGTPILTTFVGGISAVMEDKKNCLELIPKSADSTYQSIKFSLDNYHTIGSFANNATDTVFKILSERQFSHAADLNRLLKNN